LLDFLLITERIEGIGSQKFLNPNQIVAIRYSDDATIQELLPVLVLCHKSRLNRVYLENQK